MTTENFRSCERKAARRAGLALVLALVAGQGVRAQVQGPLPPPESSNGPAIITGGAPVKTDAVGRAESPLSKAPPSMPVEQVVQGFAKREAEFRQVRGNYTYRQTFIVQTVDDYSGQPDGEFRLSSDIMFTPAGQRYEKITFAPPSSLQKITMSQEDMDDLKNVQPFVLTTEELPKYDVTYVGRQQVDELETYVFDVGPKKMEKGQRYFQGRIWVDQGDLSIVKTNGKAVPDIRKRGSENVFPKFETYRENIDGHYWFPTYTHSDDTLHFQSGDVHMRMTVKYSDYKRYGSSTTIKVLSTEPDEPKKP